LTLPSTLAIWPFELLIFIYNKDRSYTDDFRRFLFREIKRECYGINNETAWELVNKNTKEIEKATAAGVLSLVRQIVRVLKIVYSGSVVMAITFAPYSKIYSQTASPKVTVQTEAWNDFYLERQLWLKLETKKFIFWSQNRQALWPGKG
jgi:hypothetical protein